MDGNGRSLAAFVSESMIKDAKSEILYETHCMYDQAYQNFSKLRDDFDRLQNRVNTLMVENDMLRSRIICLESSICTKN